MQPPQWSPEIEVGLDAARALVAAQFPALAGAPIAPFGNGWDNTAYLVDARWVFRFPRRSIAVPLMSREIAILPLLAAALPAAIPAPTYAGRPSEAFPWPFAGYERIAGTTLCSTNVRHAGLAAELGAFLRALHTIDPQAAIAVGLPPDELGRLDHAKRFPLAVERLAHLHAAGVIADPAPLVATLHAIAPSRERYQPRIVHGDLYARHVVVGENGALGGIIDWGDLHCGDPALDLAVAGLLFDAVHRRAFDEAYGTIDDRTRERARYRAIYHAAMTADYGLRVGDEPLTACSVEALARLRDEG